MKNFCCTLLGGAVALLASCHAAPDKTAPTAAAGPVPAAVAQAATVVAPAAKPPFTGYHRYRGTVGGQPVILEVLVDSSQSYGAKGLQCEGSYFYERLAGGNLMLEAPAPYQPSQPLRLLEGSTGTWQATQPLGSVLSGTWTSRTGRQLPFALREDYHEAVRYEILTHAARGNACPKPEGDITPGAWTPYARLTQSFLHLLGPDTLRPALRRLQCPPLARRRALVQVAAHNAIDDCVETQKSMKIGLNAYGLLAIDENEYVNEYNGARPHAEGQSQLYDLRAGRWLALPELLRPRVDSLQLLNQIVGRHLMNNQDTNLEVPDRKAIYWQGSDSTAVPLPQRGGVYFTSQGLIVSYDMGEIVPETYGPVEVYITYTELLPLLRPDSPVARMLRQRGLWPGAGPKRQ